MPPSLRIHLGYNSIATSFGSRVRSSKIISHWVLIVWDGKPQSFPLTSELFVKDGCVFTDTEFQDEWSPHVLKACQQQPVAHTTMTTDEIKRRALSLTGLHGDYSLLSNNCQNYVKRLLKAIATTEPRGTYTAQLVDGREKHIRLDDLDDNDSTGEGLHANAEYRFKPALLQFKDMYQGTSPGFITPGAGIILVNVRQTEDPKVCKANIKNSGTLGYVLRAAIERC